LRPGAVSPIYITEFGMDQNFCDQATVAQFLKNATKYLDGLPWVERYACFGNYPDSAGTYDGTATDELLDYDGNGRSVLGDV
jgi:hypothetical protein